MNSPNGNSLIQLFTEGLQSVLPSNFMADLIKIDDHYIWIGNQKHKLLKNLKVIAFGKASSTMFDSFVNVVGKKYISEMNVKLLSGALGAEISGIDLKDSSKKNYQRINNLLFFSNFIINFIYSF